MTSEKQKVWVLTFERKIKGCAITSMVVDVYGDREKAIGSMTSMFLKNVEMAKQDHYEFDKDYITTMKVDRMKYETISNDPDLYEYTQYEITCKDLIV